MLSVPVPACNGRDWPFWPNADTSLVQLAGDLDSHSIEVEQHGPVLALTAITAWWPSQRDLACTVICIENPADDHRLWYFTGTPDGTCAANSVPVAPVTDRWTALQKIRKRITLR
ncbi:hypothetical protein [Actinomadura rupiterrae]|uniref:hypothetical protein n=1 Tax=Actinomadura rupiterrae TaxID=559627 RepID=UPI0020A2D84B|nr:hypothetical protein [Actinomadura rupiterrae]MCP2337559.1 hypothetical protein [Actinomadura rupiterrae]